MKTLVSFVFVGIILTWNIKTFRKTKHEHVLVQVVLDFCDPGSAKEQAVYWAWIITVASMLLLSILRMVCSQKRVRKLKRNLNKKATLRDLDAARLSEQPPELTIVLKNKRTHEHTNGRATERTKTKWTHEREDEPTHERSHEQETNGRTNEQTQKRTNEQPN